MNDLCICPGCRGRTYHINCWPEADFHLPSDGYVEVCKEPADFVEYVWINYLLNSQVTREEQDDLHRQEMWSTWIDVPNRQDCSKLYVYARLEYLITHAQGLRDDASGVEQFPSLVSFFGDTGYGHI